MRCASHSMSGVLCCYNSARGRKGRQHSEALHDQHVMHAATAACWMEKASACALAPPRSGRQQQQGVQQWLRVLVIEAGR